jgi:uncharacterized OB-fold protein
MPLIDLLPADQRTTLRRLRRRIGNRENMRRYRAENRDKKLCAGVDLPLEAGTCGRLVWPAHERCYACHVRRQWLLNHALNAAEMTVAALLESVEDATAEAGEEPEDIAATEYADRAVPLLEDVSALGDPCLRW